MLLLGMIGFFFVIKVVHDALRTSLREADVKVEVGALLLNIQSFLCGLSELFSLLRSSSLLFVTVVVKVTYLFYSGVL